MKALIITNPIGDGQTWLSPFSMEEPKNPRVRSFLNRLRSSGKCHGSDRVVDNTKRWIKAHRQTWHEERVGKIAVRVWAESFMEKNAIK